MDSQMYFAVLIGVVAAIFFALNIVKDAIGSRRRSGKRSSFGTKVLCTIGVGVFFFFLTLWIPKMLHGALTNAFPQLQLEQPSK